MKKIILLMITLAIILSSCDLLMEEIDTFLNTDSEVNVNLTEGELEIHYIDVGQGDSILIRNADHAVLIDGGDTAYREFLVKYLNNQGIKKFDYVVATHPHADHIGGLNVVIENFEVDKVIMPNKSATTVSFEKFIKAMNEKGVGAKEPIAGEKFSLGDLHFTVLAPNSKEYTNTNDYSVVLKLEHGENSFIFTGDAEKLSEKEILESGYNIKADVLKVGHHGSSTSTTESFLDEVDPIVAVISLGEGNSYNHPHRETIKLLNSRDIEILRTDEMGTIILKSDGKEIFIEN